MKNQESLWKGACLCFVFLLALLLPDGSWASSLMGTRLVSHAGDGPTAVAIADLDGDDLMDAAVANNAGDGVSVLWGVGNGMFEEPNFYYTGDVTNSVAIAYLDNDMIPDLVVTNGNEDNVSILLGGGGRTFGLSASYTVGDGPVSVAAGDLDGDSDTDIVVANETSDNISVLLNNGNGTFQPAVTYAAGDGPQVIVLALLDGNGSLDIAVTNAPTDDVSVLLGNGDGTFQTAVSYGVGNYPVGLTQGNLNGDAYTDLAAVNYHDDNVSVLLGNGNGTFQPSVQYALDHEHYGALSIAHGDLDVDGKTDLAVISDWDDDVSILRGNGDGTFRAPEKYETGSKPKGIAVGLVDQDLFEDLVIPNLWGDTVSVLLGNGDVTFGTQAFYPGGDWPENAVVHDLDHDGHLDLAVANFYGDTVYTGISIHLGNGDGTFQAPVHYATGDMLYGVRFIAGEDLNDDGELDLVVANDNNANYDNVAVLIGNGDGTFQTATIYPLGTNKGPVSVAIGDLDGDGAKDLAYVKEDAAMADSLSVLFGNGDGTFNPVYTDHAAGRNPKSVAVGDLNGDDDLDLVVADYNVCCTGVTPHVSILIGDGEGDFVRSEYSLAENDHPLFVTLSDLNQDTLLDMVVVTKPPDQIYVCLGNGDGTFQEEVSYGTADAPQSVAVGDLDGDTIPDLAVANLGNGASSYGGTDGVSVLLGNGDGTFRAAVNYGVSRNIFTPQSVALGDLDEDGDLDFVVPMSDGHLILDYVAVVLNNRIRPPACQDMDGDGYGSPPRAACLYTENDCYDDPSGDPAVCSQPVCDVCGDAACVQCAKCTYPKPYDAAQGTNDPDNDCWDSNCKCAAEDCISEVGGPLSPGECNSVKDNCGTMIFAGQPTPGQIAANLALYLLPGVVILYGIGRRRPQRRQADRRF